MDWSVLSSRVVKEGATTRKLNPYVCTMRAEKENFHASGDKSMCCFKTLSHFV